MLEVRAEQVADVAGRARRQEVPVVLGEPTVPAPNQQQRETRSPRPRRTSDVALRQNARAPRWRARVGSRAAPCPPVTPTQSPMLAHPECPIRASSISHGAAWSGAARSCEYPDCDGRARARRCARPGCVVHVRCRRGRRRGRIYLVNGRKVWFFGVFGDEWDFLAGRRLTIHDLLLRHGDHLVALPALVFRLLYARVRAAQLPAVPAPLDRPPPRRRGTPARDHAPGRRAPVDRDRGRRACSCSSDRAAKTS